MDQIYTKKVYYYFSIDRIRKMHGQAEGTVFYKIAQRLEQTFVQTEYDRCVTSLTKLANNH